MDTALAEVSDGATKPAPPPALRWAVLGLASLVMFGNYYVYDCIGPVAGLLQSQLHFTDAQIGLLNAVYSIPNVFVVLVGGVLADRLGTRIAVLLFTAICFLGALLTALSGSLFTMALGRLLFGLGAESLIVAVTASLGQWFKGKQLGFAFGINLSLSRAGSFVADWSPTWARRFYDAGWQPALMVSVVFALASLAAAVLYFLMERTAEPRYELVRPKPSDRFVWSDLWRFNGSYWLVVGLCVTFYSVVLPFRSTFAIKFFQDTRGLPLDEAGQMNSWVFLAAIFATPLFGLLVDRLGRRSLFMTFGTFVLAPAFLLLAYTRWDLWISNAMIGVAFSLVPAVLWPSVPYLVEERRLGTAFGLMTLLQNIGLAFFNWFAGQLDDWGGASANNPAGYQPMLWMFALLSLAGLVFSALLRRRETTGVAHGLETIRARGM